MYEVGFHVVVFCVLLFLLSWRVGGAIRRSSVDADNLYESDHLQD
jgi:hypothetical protein